MTNNSIAISRNLVASGLELTVANAIAEEMVTHSDENLATKADLTKMEAATKSDLTKMEAATKSDLAKMEAATKSGLAKMETEMKSDLIKMEAATKSDLIKMEAATKSDLAKMDTKIEVLSTEVKAVVVSNKEIKNLIYGLFMAIFVAFVGAVGAMIGL